MVHQNLQLGQVSAMRWASLLLQYNDMESLMMDKRRAI